MSIIIIKAKIPQLLLSMLQKIRDTLLALILCSCTTGLHPFDATVVRVHDGDTLTVLFENVPTTIRLARIDAPELKQEFGMQSRDRLTELCAKKSVRIEPINVDRYDRIIAEVVLHGRNLNEQMVEEGLAWRYPEYDRNSQRMELLEKISRAERRGLWRIGSHVPPWEFRKEKRHEIAVRAQLRKSLMLLVCVFIAVVIFGLAYFWYRFRENNRGNTQQDRDESTNN